MMRAPRSRSEMVWVELLLAVGGAVGIVWILQAIGAVPS